MKETFIISRSIQKNIPESRFKDGLPYKESIEQRANQAIYNYESTIKQDIRQGMKRMEVIKKWHIGWRYYKQLCEGIY